MQAGRTLNLNYKWAHGDELECGHKERRANAFVLEYYVC